MWTRGSTGRLERAVSVPDRGVAHLVLGAEEETVVARAGVSGAAWAHIWLPAILQSDDEVLRVAPVTNSGELLGMIVVRRPDGGLPFNEHDDQALTELARQVGLALHNVKLDSALQESLDEVRRQADELRASRARIVEAADAQRRRIERDLHDGAQQHLVALAVSVNLARQIADTDPDAAKAMLEQIGPDLQDAVQELRNLAHGIYPPLLMDRGLARGAPAAAGRAALPTGVDADGIGRYPQEVEAAVYFCCLEALQNAGKHAGDGAQAMITVREDEGALLFEVADDGAGLRPRDRRAPRPRLREHERPGRRDRRQHHRRLGARGAAPRSAAASRSRLNVTRRAVSRRRTDPGMAAALPEVADDGGAEVLLVHVADRAPGVGVRAGGRRPGRSRAASRRRRDGRR